jgi:undecaprenyl-diphosphatase
MMSGVSLSPQRSFKVATVLDLIKTIILGFVEGITEFLPISSTGHLIVVTALLQPNFSDAFKNTFDIFIQLGAVIAVIAFYRADIWKQVKTVRTDSRVQHFWIAIVIAFIPAAVIGLATRSFIKNHLFSPAIVAVSLIVGGVLFIIIERMLSGRKEDQPEALLDVTYHQALIIGVIQVISLIPGVSRAATSIFGGMLTGLNRETATRFSFYLAIPTLGAATVVELLLSLKDIHGSDLAFLAVGTIVSGIVAWFAVGWLLRYIAQHNFTGFGYYRIVAGIVILVLIVAAVL